MIRIPKKRVSSGTPLFYIIFDVKSNIPPLLTRGFFMSQKEAAMALMTAAGIPVGAPSTLTLHLNGRPTADLTLSQPVSWKAGD